MRLTLRDRLLFVCAALATALLMVGGANHLVRAATPNGGVGMNLLVRR